MIRYLTGCTGRIHREMGEGAMVTPSLSDIAAAAAERAGDHAAVAEIRDRTALIVARLREITDEIGRGYGDACRCAELGATGPNQVHTLCPVISTHIGGAR